MKFLKTAFLVMLLAAGSALAQTFTYSNLSNHDNPAIYPQYWYSQSGQGPYNFDFYTFRFSITGGTGSAAALNGGDYIGFCVNTYFDDPASGDSATYSNTPTLLSYDIGGGDYWAANRAIKFEAISNILNYYAAQLQTLDPDSQNYAELVTGINIAFTEIIVDYDGTLSSININAGNNLVKADAAGNPITSGVAYDTYNFIRNNLIGSGTGGSTPIYTATAPTDAYQDIIFIPAVPEPQTWALAAIGLAAVLLRLRKSLRA